MTADRIEKKVLLRAPRARVWRALADASEFGTWFGVRFDGPFVAGETLRGVMVGTQADPEVAKLQKPHEGTIFEVVVERIEPERAFAFRWRPHAADPTGGESTLVTFELEEALGGVLLTVTESGFERISIERRARAFAESEGGWTIMVKLFAAYVAPRG